MRLKDYVKQIILQRGYRSLRAAAHDIKYPDGRPISHTTLMSILDGRENIDTDTLRALARWAGVPMRYLFDMIDAPESPMPHEHTFSALMALSPRLAEAMITMAERAREGSISTDDLNSIADFILFKTGKPIGT